MNPKQYIRIADEIDRLPIGRDTPDYGYTHLGTDEASSPWFWIVGAAVFAMLIWAVVS